MIMYLCVYAYMFVCACMYVGRHAGVYTCKMHVCTHTYMKLCVDGWMNVGRYVCMYVCIMHAWIYRQNCMYVCLCTHIYAYIHTECNSWQYVFQ